MLKRVISVLLAVAMLPLGGIVFAAQNEAEAGNRAGWFIDAESASDTFVSDEEAIGKKAVEGEFSVEFSVPEEKAYYLYARVKMASSPSSISYAFDTDEATISAISGEIGEFVWVKVSQAKVLSKGNHEVLLVPGNGVLVDGIVVSELETLPLSSSVTASKAEWAEEQALPSVYPDVFDENMINEDVHFEKGDRVLFLGDSITHSVGHTFQYHTWVLTYYATRYPDCEFTYINAGRSGDTTVEALKRLVSDVHIHDYNKIVVMLGTNDVNRVVWETHKDDREASDEVIYTFIRNLDTLLGNFSDKEIILMGPTCWNEFSNQAASSAAIVEGYNSEIRRVNNILRDYAYDNSIPYIDLNTTLTKTML